VAKPIPFGRYLLLERLAIGGMAEVYLATARDGPAGAQYAVKRILPTLAEDPEFVGMFLDEARIVAHLDHPAIAPIHELGRVGDRYFIAFEYVPGQDLRALEKRLRRAGERMPVSVAAYVAHRLADALDWAHRARDVEGRELDVVHCDVSPANVLLGWDGGVRLIDFGIAQAAFRAHRERRLLRGKLGYMTPEGVRGLAVDRRADVFSLGTLLWEMLAGEKLFTGPSELALLERVRSAEVPPPSTRNPSVLPGLDAVVLRALAREPEDRFSWASELRDALVPYLGQGLPSTDAAALRRLLARHFRAEIVAELERVARSERAREALAEADEEEPAVTDPGIELDDLDGPPPGPSRWSRPSAPRFPMARATRRKLAALGAALLVAAGVVVARAVSTAPETGRLVVQVQGAAEVRVDGVPVSPPLVVGEARAVIVKPGAHRVELLGADGSRAAATVEVRAGATQELLGFELK
jgi:serine/threonine-protein kinase